MKNYVQPGDSISVAFPYARNSGEGVKVGNAVFGVAVDTVASGATGVICTAGVYSGIAKATGAGENWTVGNRVFWDDTNKRITTTSTGNLSVGVALNAAATGDATGTIKIIPSTPAGT